MKIKIKSNKGISLATIVISIILMIIILSTIVLSVNKTTESKKAMQLNSDIEELSRKVNLYYLQNGEVQVDDTLGELYSESLKVESKGKAKYYRLLIDGLENLNLTYKEEFDADKNVKKCYVINLETHLIYYVEKVNGIWTPVKYKYSDSYNDFINNADVEYNKEIPSTTMKLFSLPQVGDYVNYEYDKVEEGYTVNASYLAFNYENDSIYGSEIAKIRQLSDLTWRILDIDKSNNKMLIVSYAPVENKDVNNKDTRVIISGARGVTNGVFILNDVCEKLYSSNNENYNIKARSINLDDINNVANIDIYEEYLKETEIDPPVELPEVLKFEPNDKGYNSLTETKTMFFDKLKIFDKKNVQLYSLVATKDDFNSVEKEILTLKSKQYGYAATWGIATRLVKYNVGSGSHSNFYTSGLSLGAISSIRAQFIYSSASTSADGLNSTMGTNVRPVIEIDLNEYKLVNKEDTIVDGHTTPDTGWEIRKR